MKPDWSEAPSFAKWLAQDKNGDWFFYIQKPILTEHHWKPVDNDIFRYIPKIDGWENTLEERPS